MASFQAEIGWKRLRNREIKNYLSVSFLLDAKQKIPKKQQKNSKTYKEGHEREIKNIIVQAKIPLWHHFKPKQVG